MPGHKAPEEQRRAAILRAAFVVASRERLEGLTVRKVAAQAGVSPGLVHFHFGEREALLVALLGWLLRHTVPAGELRDILDAPAFVDAAPRTRLLALVRRDIEHLPRRRDRVELFFDYWVMGTRNPAVRATIRRALDRYRDAFLPVATDVVRAEPDRYEGVTPLELAAVVASFVEGCALRVVLTPDDFDVGRYLAAVQALVDRPAAAPRSAGLPPGIAFPSVPTT